MITRTVALKRRLKVYLSNIPPRMHVKGTLGAPTNKACRPPDTTIKRGNPKNSVGAKGFQEGQVSKL